MPADTTDTLMPTNCPPSPVRGYLANGLFSAAERMFNDHVAQAVRNSVTFPTDLFVPQEAMEINDKSKSVTSTQIATYDTEKLMEADYLIAVIDGVEIDSGVACEIGMFATTNRPVYALYTDMRTQGHSSPDKLAALGADPVENQVPYRNLFVIGVVKSTPGGVVLTIEDLVEKLQVRYS